MAAQGFELFAADVSRYAPGLYLVPEGNRLCLPAGESKDYLREVLAACARFRIDVLVPTVDDELRRLSAARASFARLGTAVMVPPADAVAPCLDLLALVERFRGRVPIPKTAMLDGSLPASDLRFPLVMRARQPVQDQGMHLLLDRGAFEAAGRDPGFVVQEYMSGTQYDVQVLGTREGEIRGVVPVASLGAGSGFATVRRTVRHATVDGLARDVYLELGLRGPASICFREDRKGRPHLTAVHPRVGAGVQLAAAAGVAVGPDAVRDLLGMPVGPVADPIREVASVAIAREEIVPVRSLDVERKEPRPATIQSSDVSDDALPGAKASLLLH
jgi:carbamoyl-phosphate synthase large subunit